MTTNPHIKAGGLPPTQLHRVDASLLSDNRVVEQFGEPAPLGLMKYANSPMPYTDIEPMRSFGEWRPLFTGVLVALIAGLFFWWRA